MLTKTLSFAGAAILGAAMVLSTAEPVQAAPPGPNFRFGGLGRFGGFNRFGGSNRFGGPNRFFNRFPLRYNGGYGFNAPYSVDYPGYYNPYYGSSYANSFYEYAWTVNSPATPVLTAEEKDARALLTASGVPTEEGRPVWPLALRVLPGSDAESLRGQIDALLQDAATHAARGQPNSAVVKELVQATDRLRKLLVRHREERGGLAQTSYEEAERFLDKLEGSRTLLRIGKEGNDAADQRP
jgi:hypothetical protein